MGNISWTKSWSASDNGSVFGGADIGNIQNDITTVVNGGITNANINASAAIAESKIAFDTSTGHDHDGSNSKRVAGIKFGYLTRDQTVAAGTQEVSVGFQPRAVIFFTAQTPTSEVSIGAGDATTNGCVYNYHGITGDTWGHEDGKCIYALESSGVWTKGEITTLGSSSFTITWTKSGSPAGVMGFTYLAIG
jgi:hypothetical protein